MGQRINDLKEFHNYLQKPFMPCDEQIINEVAADENLLAGKEKLYITVVRTQKAFDGYTAFLESKNSLEFIEDKQIIEARVSGDWVMFLERLATGNYLAFSGENGYFFWDSENEKKEEAFKDIWQEKRVFFIVKEKYLDLFRNNKTNVLNFWNAILFAGIVFAEGEAVMLFSQLYDCASISKKIIKK